MVVFIIQYLARLLGSGFCDYFLAMLKDIKLEKKKKIAHKEIKKCKPKKRFWSFIIINSILLFYLYLYCWCFNWCFHLKVIILTSHPKLIVGMMEDKLTGSSSQETQRHNWITKCNSHSWWTILLGFCSNQSSCKLLLTTGGAYTLLIPPWFTWWVWPMYPCWPFPCQTRLKSHFGS